MLSNSVLRHLESVVGASVQSQTVISGGDINDAYRLNLAGGRSVFLKTHRQPPPGLYEAEAEGLAFLRECNAIRVPELIATGIRDAPYLALEFIESAPRVGDFDEVLGRSLATLHRVSLSSFGATTDNFIALLTQSNRAATTWPEFLVTERLEPQLRMAHDRGLVDEKLMGDFQRLFTRMDRLTGPDEPPARLHGDLWGGNLHVDEQGLPCLIDPAVYGGHREMDLAMMRLFGGFSDQVFAAYHEVFPLTPGADQRVSLCQLYPLLVHVNLFGSSYVASVERNLSQYM